MKRPALLLGVFMLASPATAAPTLPRLFLTADRCVACHNGIVTPSGEDVSIGLAWSPTIMANSSRDPYWQASIRRETLEHPPAGAAIENECAACHMPMARYLAKAQGREGKVFAHLPVFRQRTVEDALAADGVSCALCHQIGRENLGSPLSFTAGFVIDTVSPPGKREVFGPFDIDQGRANLMRSSSEFRPARSPHIRTAELCASCHTLYTQALNERSEVIGTLPEQVPYLEWKHSAYAGAQTCPSCHMPAVDSEIPITGTVGKPREGVSRHVFRGGNFLIQRMLSRYREALGARALAQQSEVSAARTIEHLETEAAELSVRRAEIEGGFLRAEISVRNLTGHKLPTAYPSRRAWIHVAVLDAAGHAIFESGRPRPDGSIEGNDNDIDRSRFEPHHVEISRPEDVQIYEGILAGPAGEVTTVLLTAVRYIKDNRLLPDGFDKSTAEADIAPKGGAAADTDFKAGGDEVRYVVNTGGAAGPYEVRAELLYQPISFRWAHNLDLRPSAESERFKSTYGSLSDCSAVVLARARSMVKAR